MLFFPFQESQQRQHPRLRGLCPSQKGQGEQPSLGPGAAPRPWMPGLSLLFTVSGLPDARGLQPPRSQLVSRSQLRCTFLPAPSSPLLPTPQPAKGTWGRGWERGGGSPTSLEAKGADFPRKHSETSEGTGGWEHVFFPSSLPGCGFPAVPPGLFLIPQSSPHSPIAKKSSFHWTATCMGSFFICEMKIMVIATSCAKE